MLISTSRPFHTTILRKNEIRMPKIPRKRGSIFRKPGRVGHPVCTGACARACYFVFVYVVVDVRNIFCYLSQIKSHSNQERSRNSKDKCTNNTTTTVRAHNFKARTTDRRKGLTVTLARTLCGVPWSALCLPHACHRHGVWVHPPGSRIQQTVDTSIHYGALSQRAPSDPLLTKEWRRTHGS